jgi:GT2 family glycosyltransferase
MNYFNHKSLSMKTEKSLAPLPSDLHAADGRVSVVIVVWNAKKYVLECLESLREWCQSAYAEVIVVDNASSDGTPELIEQRFPEFKLIRNPENFGFAKANNIGIAQSTGSYVCLVNSDVKFTEDCITPMVKYMNANPGVAMLGPKMLAADGIVRRSTMRFPTVWSTFCHALGLDVIFKKSRVFGGWLMADFDHMRTMPVQVLNGWFVVVRRSAMEQVGLLDAQFFMYGEDMDWCKRFHEAGHNIVFFAGAEAIHYGGGSSSSAPIQFYLEQCRANWRYWRKHHGIMAQIGFLGCFGIHHCVRLVSSGLVYLCSPSRRSQTRLHLRRSVVCLQWIGGAVFSQ